MTPQNRDSHQQSSSLSPHQLPWQPPMSVLALWVCLVRALPTHGVIQRILLCDWLPSGSKMSSQSIHGVEGTTTSCFYMAKYPSIAQIDHLAYSIISGWTYVFFPLKRGSYEYVQYCLCGHMV